VVTKVHLEEFLMWPYFILGSKPDTCFPPMSAEAKRIVDNAVSIARQNAGGCLSTADLLTGILSTKSNEALDLLDRIGFSSEAALEAIAMFTLPGLDPAPNDIILTPYTRQVFVNAEKCATDGGRKQIEPIDLLRALAETPGSIGPDLLGEVQDRIGVSKQ
jgi:hypothetical protein